LHAVAVVKIKHAATKVASEVGEMLKDAEYHDMSFTL
jgi:hypothetical protein